MTPRSALLTREEAERAVEFVRASINELMLEKTVGRMALHVVILDPAKPFGSCEFADAILYECNVAGDHTTWERSYDKFARAKAFISWRTGLSSHAVRELRPYLLVPDDVKFGGSTVHEGIVVGASGVESWYDEMFAAWIAAACRAITIHRMQTKILPDDKITHLP